MTERSVKVEDRDFSLHTGHACAVAACLAYEDQQRYGHAVSAQFQGRAARFGFAHVKPLRRREHYAVVFDMDHHAIVSFRGTDELQDWLTNLNSLPRQTTWGRVHCGFSRALDRFWTELPEEVFARHEEGKRVWLTGHSLGGALAVLAAARLQSDDNLECAGIYTFGQPAVGFAAFCRVFEGHFGGRYHRFVNHVDFVADIPIHLIRHISEPWVFDADGELEQSPGWFTQIRTQWRAQRVFGGLAMIKAHGRELYANNFDGQIQSPSSA